MRCHGLVSAGVWHLVWIPREAEVCAGVWGCATSAGREPWGMKAAGGNWVCVKLSCLTKPRRIQRRQAWHLHPLCRKITDNKLCVCETMRTESLLLNLIKNNTQQQFFHWSCFPGLSKLWLKEKNVVIWFPCLSALLSRIKGISGLLPTTYLPLYCNPYIQHSSFSVMHLSRLCAKIPWRPGSHCLWLIAMPCL